ncbi:DUF4349 domain-containing protein [Gottschalkiaceae bacterium SANA]|nr:DUF4349 domain-containing protein [Gottschalkiaceae bacterium SANA]
MKKKISAILLFLVLILLIAGCSQSKDSEFTDSRNESMAAMEAPGMPAPEYDMAESVTSEEFSLNKNGDPLLDTTPLGQDERQKMTYSGSASIETETFDDTLLGLDQWIQEFDAMIASSRIEDHGSFDQPRRYASYTIRIPAENFQKAIQILQNQVQVRRLQLDSQDVTDHYFDLTARIESAQTHESRLLALVEKSTELKDVLALEQELNRIRYEIENNQGILRRLDSQVRYSTLYIDIQETKNVLPEPITFFDRVKNQIARAGQQIVDGLQGIILWAILWLPTLFILGLLFFILYRFTKRLVPIWKKKKDPLESDHK